MTDAVSVDNTNLSYFFSLRLRMVISKTYPKRNDRIAREYAMTRANERQERAPT
jgi:hypothetical protein